MKLSRLMRRSRVSSAAPPLVAFGLGALGGYLLATHAWPHSAAYLAGLALGLAGVSLWRRGQPQRNSVEGSETRRSFGHEAPGRPSERAAREPLDQAYDLRGDRSTDRQRFPM